MQEKVYKKWIKDVDKLHAHILIALDKMDQQIIDKAVRQWQSRCTRFICGLVGVRRLTGGSAPSGPLKLSSLPGII